MARSAAIHRAHLWALAVIAMPIFFGAAAAGAQQAANAGADAASPLRVSGVHARPAERAPVLDGRDTDAAWRTASAAVTFREFDPVEDGEPRFRTEARVSYDAANLYVFVRAFDPRPDSIVRLLARRDVKTPSDQIKVMIDSYHDRRSGYEFAVNPAGVKRDFAILNDAQEDVTWDAVWDVATVVDSLGWTAEFRIPWSQLRFARAQQSDSSRTLGIMIMRDIARTSERVSWPVFRRSRPGIASQFAELTGVQALAPVRRLEAIPYGIARNVGVPHAARDGGLQFGRTQQLSLGVDLKVGLTDGVTLDATVNPDFGQVEADPAQLNLTAFEPFFEERRPFFLKGAGMFAFDPSAPQLFYTRRIGRAPQLAGLVADPTQAVPGASTILGAAKLTGRAPRGATMGLIVAVTAAEQVPGASGPLTLEPQTAYGVARVAQDFRSGESGIGLMATTIHRTMDLTTAARLRRSALSLGADARHRFGGGGYQVTASIIGSAVDGTSAAIARTQRSATHYYHRPDAALPYDTSITRLTGTALSLGADRVAGVVRGGASYQRITPGFEINDLGFLPQADQQTTRGYLSVVSRRPVGPWRNASATVSLTEQANAAGLPTARVPELLVASEWRNASRTSIDIWVDNAGPVYCDRCARGGPALRLSPAANMLVNWAGNPRRVVLPSVAAIYTVGDGGRSTLWRVRPYVVVRSRSNVSWELGTRYQRNRDNTQWYGNRGIIGSDSAQYLFAALDQHLLSFTGRVNVTVTPALSIQAYAEPFVTTGEYTRFRTLATPRAREYDDRFVAAGHAADGFNTKQLRTNLVARWEYRPGSAIFLVWAQGRNQDDRDAGSFEPARDYRNLFAARPDNTLLLKASYWFGR